MTPEESLDKAIATVTGMLVKKKEIWTAGEGLYKNFEIHTDLGITPLQFGLAMCNLKMQRAKTRYMDNNAVSDDAIEDSLIDLASYALLSLGILYHSKDEGSTLSPEDLEWIRNQQEKLASTQVCA